MWNSQKKSKLKQQTAYDKKVTHDLFEIVMEWVEKYIEVAYKKEFPNWEKRKQIHDNNIKRQDIYGNPEIAEETLSTQLLLFQSTAKNKSPAIREEIKEEYYRWMNAVGIDVNNCPKRLKNFLFGINEILEGRGEKVLIDAINRKEAIDSNSSEYMQQMMNLYANTQSTSREEIEIEKSLRGKTDKDWKIKNKFGSGDSERGKQQFDEIAGEIADEHENFHFYPQQGQQQSASSGGTPPGSPPPPPPTDLDEVVQDVKSNSSDWRVDEIITEFDNFGGTKQEIALFRRDARLNDYNHEGKLNFDRNPIYRWESFNAHQRFEIKKAKNIAGDYLTNDEIKWIVKEVKSNPSIWRIGTEKGKIYLIHNSAQGNDNEVGTLIHDKQKFSALEWAEMERVKLIDNIKRNISEWKIQEVITSNGHRWDFNQKKWVSYDNEIKQTALIKKSAQLEYNEQGVLEIDPKKMFLKDAFNEVEWTEIGWEIAQRKLNHPTERESWENDQGILEWISKLEQERSSQFSRGLISESQQHFNKEKVSQQVQPTKTNDKPTISGGTVAIIGGTLATIGAGIFFITKSKKKPHK